MSLLLAMQVLPFVEYWIKTFFLAVFHLGMNYRL